MRWKISALGVVFEIQTSEGDTNFRDLGNERPQVGSRAEAPGGGLRDSLRICEGEGVPWRPRRARAYNEGLGAEPPAGFRGRASDHGVRGVKPP